MAAMNPTEEFKQPEFKKISIPSSWMGFKPISNSTGFRYIDGGRNNFYNKKFCLLYT